MRDAIRPDIPPSLKEHGPAWTAELMDAVEAFQLHGTPIPKLLKNRYGKKDVQAALKIMYGDGTGRYYCCYCEEQIVRISAPRIEHRKPKSHKRFPQNTYDWDNLHLACETCNGNKSDKWNYDNPILDAVIDAPISDHLTYEEDFDTLSRKDLTRRGWTTIEHVDLNSQDLGLGRLKVYAEMMRLMMDIRNCLDKGQIAGAATKALRQKRFGMYGSMISYLLDKYLPNHHMVDGI